MTARKRRAHARLLALVWILLVLCGPAGAQIGVTDQGASQSNQPAPKPLAGETVRVSAEIDLAVYYDSVRGITATELVRRALSSNEEMQAVRLGLERGKARLLQAGARPNPSVEFHQMTGRLTGSPGEREISLGVSLPLELGGKRQRRIDLARAELEAAKAEVEDRERRLSAEVRMAYADALAAFQELEITQTLHTLDRKTVEVVHSRVAEGESAPVELNLLRVELERIQARRVLVEGRLQAALQRLRTLAGMDFGENLRLRDDRAGALFEPAPEEAVEIALRMRPDLRLARLTEEAARAGLRLVRAQATPDLTAFGTYKTGTSIFDTIAGPLRDADRTVTFGVSLGIPLFNRNQGAAAEAAIVVAQAERRRHFLELTVRSEVRSAYARYVAAKAALTGYEQGVLALSTQNIRTVRGAYEIGAFKVTDLLVEQRRFLDAQREFIEIRAEQARAIADLEAAIGLPVDSGSKSE